MAAWIRSRRPWARWASALCGLALVGGAASANAAPDPPGPAGAPGDRTITLLTGDRVRVVGDAYAVAPGPGRERMAFDDRTVDGHRYVIPADALAPLGSGQVDRRLFDITTLLDLGDGGGEVPLLVTRGADPAATTARLAGAGVRGRRDLPGLGLLAVRAPSGERAWGELVGSGQRIWLDGRRTVSLDRSVPRTGAPKVWAGGHTGRGVPVAVLDTGIDAAHPDLAGRVARSMNFTDDPDATDTVGHGTHVASILAGSGAASGGRYRGVAPDATLLAGKVCTIEGCPESAILAGLDWAATAGARVVNLSFGGPDGAELDPVEAAIDALTARYGTLFVAAAGNGGPGPGTIESPASADAALAVGAVDGTDRLAPFSSRGPSAGNRRIKPDITAPGVDIVAAQATNTEIGEPVEAGYVRLSGTSMAAPHAAGAAALLAQQHPLWRAAELKASLLGSAAPSQSLDAYQQGGGRLDVAAASVSGLRADPPSLQLGVQRWPHNDDLPVRRTVTYHNDGAGAVRLSVTLDVTAPGGGRAAAGMFTVAPDEVTVPAGATATVTLTADTARNGPDGVYFGRLSAAGATGTVRTAFTVEREPESYDVTLTHLDREGVATANYRTSLDGVDRSGTVEPYGPDGTVTTRLPRGRYHLDSTISTVTGDLGAHSKIVLPNLDLTRDTAIVLDARSARPVDVRVTRPGARPLLSAVGYHRRLPTGEILDTRLIGSETDQLFSLQLGDNAPVAGLVGRVLSAWGVPGSDGAFGDGAHLYSLAFHPRGRLPTGFVRQVHDGELAVVRAEHRTGRPGLPAAKATTSSTAETRDALALVTTMTLPAGRTEYYNSGDVRWSAAVDTPDGSQFSAPTAYPRGRSAELWFAAPMGPGLSPAGTLVRDHWVTRSGDRIIGVPPLRSDRTATHVGTGGTFAVWLHRNGKPVPSGDGRSFAVPPAAASYRLEAKSVASTELSTRVDVAWTFRSAHVPTSEPLPVAVVRFNPSLDDNDAAPAGRAFVIPFAVQRQTGDAPVPVASVAVDVSYDDGRTWQPATVDRDGPDWTARVSHPDIAGFVSLRAAAKDRAGNSVRQTMIRAYRLSR